MRKPKTLDERARAASGSVSAALSLFEVAATKLEAAAEVHAEIGREARAEAAKLAETATTAEGEAQAAAAQADTIRRTFGLPS